MTMHAASFAAVIGFQCTSLWPPLRRRLAAFPKPHSNQTALHRPLIIAVGDSHTLFGRKTGGWVQKLAAAYGPGVQVLNMVSDAALIAV